jgi:hypothetical protein
MMKRRVGSGRGSLLVEGMEVVGVVLTWTESW